LFEVSTNVFITNQFLYEVSIDFVITNILGCPDVHTCKDTEHNCCSDGVTPATGPKNEGCPPSMCNATLYGCCSDGFSIALGNDFEGCPVELPVITTTLAPDLGCKNTQ